MKLLDRQMILALLLLIMCLCHSRPVQADIDANNLDLTSLFEQMTEQGKERESSRVRIGYFSPGSEVIEFRVALEPSDKADMNEFVWMEDSHHKRFLVSKKAELTANDIYGILIEKTTYKGEDEYTV